jgi:hypothetical protein
MTIRGQFTVNNKIISESAMTEGYNGHHKEWRVYPGTFLKILSFLYLFFMILVLLLSKSVHLVPYS